MNFLWLGSFSILLTLLTLSRLSWAALPPDAVQLLERLPGKAVTLDVVLARAIQASNSYRQVLAQYPLVEVPELTADAPFDPRFFARYDWTDNRNQPTNPFMPANISGNAYALGVSTAFNTGTSLSAQLETGSQGFEIGPSSVGFYQSRMSLSLTQDLWQNSFGSAYRSSSAAGKAQREAALAQFYESIQDWSLGLMGVFYDAWMAKMRVLSASENLSRRTRLEKIMLIRTRRGTAEEPDLLQVRSALLAAQTQEAEARQALIDKWQALVVNLGLPESWLNLDPREIPMEIDEPTEVAKKICQKPPSQLADGQVPAHITKFQKESEAAKLKWQAARSQSRPDLELKLSATANAVDNFRRDPTIDETQEFTYPAYALGVQLTVPLLSRAEEAQYRMALAEKSRAEARANQALDQWRLDWMSACGGLNRLVETERWLKTSLEYQLRRARLDERRFEIGRTSILSVVQAGDDASYADINLRATQVQARLAAWRVQRLHDGLKSYLSRLEKLEIKGL